MVGIDIIKIDKIKLKESFIRYILTDKEYEYYLTINNDKRRKEYIAGRFASKEAIFKATQDINYLSYSILNKENGQPYVLNHSEIEISISHDEDYCIATVKID